MSVATRDAVANSQRVMLSDRFQPELGIGATALEVRSWPETPVQHDTPLPTLMVSALAHWRGGHCLPPSNFRLLGDFEGIIDFYAEVPHSRFQFGVPEEQLYGAKVLGSSIDQRRLGPAHRMRPVFGAV